MQLPAKKSTNEVSIPSFISYLFFTRTQAHTFHLQTSSYAKHKALNDYYDNIIDLVDDLVETYQGTNPIIKGYTNDFRINNSEESAVMFFEQCLNYVKTNRNIFGDETDLQNIIDEITSLIKSTLYKLTKLK